MKGRAWLLLAILTLTACRGFQQAYDERVCWRSGLPEECPAHWITLRCRQVPPALRVGRGLAGRSYDLDIRPTPPHARAGRLFSQYGDKPIYLDGPPASATLALDLASILQQAGLQQPENGQYAELKLAAEITRLEVHSEPGGFFDIKVPTIATASFRITARDHGGGQLWQQEFEGHDEASVMYAYLKDSEDALGRAYCQALHAFQQFLTTAPAAGGFVAPAGRN